MATSAPVRRLLVRTQNSFYCILLFFVSPLLKVFLPHWRIFISDADPDVKCYDKKWKLFIETKIIRSLLLPQIITVVLLDFKLIFRNLRCKISLWQLRQTNSLPFLWKLCQESLARPPLIHEAFSWQPVSFWRVILLLIQEIMINP